LLVPFNRIPIGGGPSPDGTGCQEFYIHRATLDQIEQEGPEWKYEDAGFIFEAVRIPDAIFEGLGRDGYHDGICHTVRPSINPADPESVTPPRFGVVFVMFVRGGGEVFDWEWREEDPDEPGHPLNWRDDFARRTWHRT
jgi:hypothetical protein